MARNPVYRMARREDNAFFGVDRGVSPLRPNLTWDMAWVDEPTNYPATVKTVDIDLCAAVAGQIALEYCKKVGYIP